MEGSDAVLHWLIYFRIEITDLEIPRPNVRSGRPIYDAGKPRDPAGSGSKLVTIFITFYHPKILILSGWPSGNLYGPNATGIFPE